LLEAGAAVNARMGDIEGKLWANCTPRGLLEVQDRTGEGGSPMPEDVKADLWKLLRDYGATV
jgi:hypothetical protein